MTNAHSSRPDTLASHAPRCAPLARAVHAAIGTLPAAAALPLACALPLLCAEPAAAQNIAAQAFVSGLNKPIDMVPCPGDATRLLVAEQRGVIKLVKNGVLQASPFLDLDAAVPEATYAGLFGIALHPDYASNGRLYVFHTTGPTNAIVVWVKEYTRMVGDPDHADPASMRVILRLASPATTAHHLGGTIAFGPDGKLWIPLGDGGTTGDATGGVRAQSDTSLWGKLLRIDVNGDDFPADSNANYAIPADNPYAQSGTVAREIFARGLRNPYRARFDRATGELWIGDVGLTQREEIDLVDPALDGGANLGWNCMEGTICTSNGNCTCPAGLKQPVHQYTYVSGACVMGGARYRGCAMPGIEGLYFYADYGRNKLFTVQYNDATGVASGVVERTAQLGSPTLSTPVCIAEDLNGELYVVEHIAGRVRRLVLNPLPADSDGDGIPDACEPVTPDLNGDGVVNGADLGILLANWGQTGQGDLNGDQFVDGGDLGELLAAWTVD